MHVWQQAAIILYDNTRFWRYLNFSLFAYEISPYFVIGSNGKFKVKYVVNQAFSKNVFPKKI